MIDCPNGELRDRLPEYLHDQLAPAERATVAAHVAGCAACAAEIALLRELRGVMGRAPSVDVAKIVAALPSASHRGARRVMVAEHETRWRRFDWRVAAAIVVLAAGGSAAAILSGAPQRRYDVAPTVGASTTTREVASIGVTMEAYTSEASVVELEALLDELDAFDGLPAGEPEPAVATPSDIEGGL